MKGDFTSLETSGLGKIKFYLGEIFQYAFREDKIHPWRFRILFQDWKTIK